MGNKQLWPGWETVRVIGSGGFGKVYEIRKIDDAGEFHSALKVISIPRSPEDYHAYVDDGYDEDSITTIFKTQIEDVVAEFKMMAQFKGTSNIVSYEDHMIVPHEDGFGWDILIRMELLTSLPEYYRQTEWTIEKTIKLGMDICRALELCAQKNIIHRDVKPQNIFVNEFGNFKLGDFGVARTMDHTTRATKAGAYGYMAPEVELRKPYNTTADIYSLGLVLCWLLNERRLPFLPLPPAVPSAAENEKAQDKRLSGEVFPDPVNGNAVINSIILKACSADPSERYPSATDMREALANIVQEAPSISVPKAPEEDVTVTEEMSGTSDALHCEYCGAVITPRTAVCPKCGKQTDVTLGTFDVICKFCGCVTSANGKYCSHCGSNLAVEPEPECRTSSNVAFSPQTPSTTLLFSKVPEVGDIITFGRYQKGDTPYDVSGIEWHVLDKENDLILILSKYALDCKKYNDVCKEVTWEDCTLRKWLNSQFIRDAFTDDEEELIATVTLENESNSGYGTHGGNDTQDKVFLLSFKEINRYFHNYNSKKCVPTCYAIYRGVWTSNIKTKDDEQTCWWWLRSPGDYQDCAGRVHDFGGVIYYGGKVDLDNGGVRPAMWLNLQ